MNISEIEMDLDLRMSIDYEKLVKEILENDEDFEEIENLKDINSKNEGSVKLKTGFSKKEIDEIWEKL